MDIFDMLEEQEKLKKEIFDMVYQWGLWNVVADSQAPAFQMAMKEFKEYIKGKTYKDNPPAGGRETELSF